VVQNVSTDSNLSGLASCVALTEPGALVHTADTDAGASAIDLALGCVLPGSSGGAVIEVELIRSVDHGASWSFVSTLIDEADAVALGAVEGQVNAPDLFTVGAATYLIATPDGNVATSTGTTDGYRGCLVFEVADLDAGQLARCGGMLQPVTEYLGDPEQFVGACTAAQGASAMGVVVPTATLTGASPSFAFFASHSGPP
jgi:hypothetical protein